MKKDAGFTLIEVIAVLVLVGIISAVAGLGIVKGVEGYLFAQSNTEITQKAQLALARMTRELMDLSTIDTSTATKIVFTTPSTPSGERTTIELNNSHELLLDGNVLTDIVHGFTVSYCETGSVLPCPAAPSTEVKNNPKLLTRIDITLQLIGPDVTSVNFTTSVVPRQTRVKNAPTG